MLKPLPLSPRVEAILSALGQSSGLSRGKLYQIAWREAGEQDRRLDKLPAHEALAIAVSRWVEPILASAGPGVAQ